MIFENQSNNKKILLLVFAILLLVGAFLFLYSPVIFQEGNPWPQIKGIAQLTFSKTDMVKLSGSDNKYLTENQGGPRIVEAYMKDGGYEYIDQMGSGYFYKSSDKTIVLIRRQYSRFYVIWTITKNSNDADNNLWTTTTNNEEVTYQYPKELLAKYISVAEWPPVVKIATGTYSCKTTPQEVSSKSDITSQRMVDDRIYCVNVKHEGAAGSVYSSYTYITPKNGKLVNVSFTLRYPNCNNYDEEQNKACASEREAFDIDATVDRIVQTVKLDLSQSESLSDQIRKCIVMSDTASHEKCNELLVTIRNFDDCANAGFSIMQSNPPQCTTPDGRNFTDETNSDWNVILTALSNCEAESVFQTHSKLVTLKLKNDIEITAYEPQIDDIMKAVEDLNGKCGDIRLATE